MLQENEELKSQINSLTEQNNILIQDQTELTRLKELYDLDQEYTDYPKVAARIISKDPGNWYDTFMINKGSNNGIRVDNNVIAGKGLVGIVTEVGPSWATVRSIIDDSSNVSAMAVSTSDNCVVTGDLKLIDEGKLSFEQLYDQDNKVTVGERIVTSNISEKYVEGLFIGYVSEIQQDPNNLTKAGTIVTPVDFGHLKDVFVITTNKTGRDRQIGGCVQWKNRIILFITIIVCFLLQCTVMDRISIGSITPNLLLILCVSMGLMRGRKVGLWTGIFFRAFLSISFMDHCLDFMH